MIETPSFILTLGQAGLSGTLAPAWLVLPLALIALATVGGHMRAVARSGMPASRKRIRTANGWLMLLLIPLLAYGFGVATPAHKGVFVMVWLAAIALLWMVVMLAGIDMVNSWRLGRRERESLRAEILAARAMLKQKIEADLAAQRPERASEGEPRA